MSIVNDTGAGRPHSDDKHNLLVQEKAPGKQNYSCDDVRKGVAKTFGKLWLVPQAYHLYVVDRRKDLKSGLTEGQGHDVKRAPCDARIFGCSSRLLDQPLTFRVELSLSDTIRAQSLVDTML